MSDTNFPTASGLQLIVQPDLLKAALEYASRGIPIFPLEPQGKKPVVKWGSEATTDPEQIQAWWQQSPNYNIGLVTGAKSDLAVVDFDSQDALARGKALGLPIGPTVKTGRGFHIYCQYSDGVRNFHKRADLPEIDLRGEGGYVVAPPSVHENGETYIWFSGKGLGDIAPPALPEWILAKAPDEKTPVKSLSAGVPEGQRNNALARLVGSWLQEDVAYENVIIHAEKWNQHNTPPLDEKELFKTIDSIYKREHGSSPNSPEEWQDPILFDGIDTPEISAGLLPSWLGEYTRAVSQFTQTPEALGVMVGLSAVATCVQKRFEVSPYGDDYTEPLSIWTATILSPSERKTPVLTALTKPLRDWEVSQTALLEQQINENNSRREINLKRIEKLKADASRAAEETERQTLLTEILQIKSETPEEVFAPRLWTGDVTAETLQDMLVEQSERMALISDEGGIFEIMAGLYNDGKVNIDVFLQAYSGSPVRVNRKSRTVDLNRPALTFGLTVQPAVIESFAHGSKRKFRDKGALARFLFCIPESRVGKRDHRDRKAIPPAVWLRYKQGMNRLLEIEGINDENGIETPRLLTLNSEALEHWLEFAEYIEELMAPDGSLATLTDWAGKLPGNALRIAGLMHLVEHSPTNLQIGKETIMNALNLCDLLIGHAQATFGMVTSDAAECAALAVFKWLQNRNFEGFSRHYCHRQLHGRFPTIEDLKRPLKMLEERHIIREYKIQTAGRPSVCFTVNPKLLSK